MSRRHHQIVFTGCLLLAGTSALPALAQTTDAGADARAGVFPASWFESASPANAYDMVQRLPGFTLVQADADVRGYAGASGNVLVDGARPTSKRQDTSQLLQQIAARSVERIELVYSGTPGIDMGGYPVLANVVLRRDASTEWAVEAGGVASTDGWNAAQAQLEYGRRWGERAFDLSLKSRPELDDDSGAGRIETENESGTVQSTWDVRTVMRKLDAETNWRQPLAGGHLSLNLAARGESARSSERITGAEDHADGGERVEERESYRESELGARYVRPLGTHTTLTVLATRQQGRQTNTEESREDDERARYLENISTGETIARLEMTHAWNDRLSMLAGFEAARNMLQSDNRLQENGDDVSLPGARVRVEERRSEASAGLTWHPDDRWTLEAGLRLEHSTLSQTGEGALRRSFRYPKPRISARWVASATQQWRFALSREVGQLQFEDFAASASLSGGTVSAGNANLQPERSLRMELGWDWHPTEESSLGLAWTHERLTDVVDRILVTTEDDVFDAPGNIGGGRRDSLALELATPLLPGTLPGTRLRISVLRRFSRVRDPLTDLHRRISEEKPVEAEVELTQDLPALRANWGLLVEHIGERKTKYRHDRLTSGTEAIGWTLYAERRIGNGWRMRVEATDLFGRDFLETREKYDGTRAGGIIKETELRRRTTPGTVSFMIRRSVGG